MYIYMYIHIHTHTGDVGFAPKTKGAALADKVVFSDPSMYICMYMNIQM
jgi:hypothetical protein